VMQLYSYPLLWIPVLRLGCLVQVVLSQFKNLTNQKTDSKIGPRVFVGGFFEPAKAKPVTTP